MVSKHSELKEVTPRGRFHLFLCFANAQLHAKEISVFDRFRIAAKPIDRQNYPRRLILRILSLRTPATDCKRYVYRRFGIRVMPGRSVVRYVRMFQKDERCAGSDRGERRVKWGQEACRILSEHTGRTSARGGAYAVMPPDRDSSAPLSVLWRAGISNSTVEAAAFGANKKCYRHPA